MLFLIFFLNLILAQEANPRLTVDGSILLRSPIFVQLNLISFRKLLESGNDLAIKDFENKINFFQKNLSWSRADLIQMFSSILPNFDHYETGKYLDEKM